MKTRDIAITGILIALQILTLLIVYLLPTIKLTLLVAVSLYSGILLRIGVKKKAVLVAYIAASILMILLIQVPQIQIAFIAFFGWYGLMHESTRNMPLLKKQLIRWAGFFVSMTVLYLIIRFVVPIELNYALWIIALAGTLAFLAFQFAFEIVVKEFIKMTHINFFNGKITFRK